MISLTVGWLDPALYTSLLVTAVALGGLLLTHRAARLRARRPQLVTIPIKE